MSGHEQPVCFRATPEQLQKTSKTTTSSKTDAFCHCAARCIFMGRQACSSVATLDLCAHYCWWKTPAPTPERWREILLSTAGRTTRLHPSLYRGGRAVEARLEFLSFDGMGGGVQACNQTHCLYDQLPVRRIQGTAMLNYRHTDSVLFGNRTCCTIKTFGT